jgi:hypothetical protein
LGNWSSGRGGSPRVRFMMPIECFEVGSTLTLCEMFRRGHVVMAEIFSATAIATN